MSLGIELKIWRLSYEVDVASEGFTIGNGGRFGDNCNWCGNWNFGFY